MVDAKNTEQARDAHRGNGQVPEGEPHVTHLLPAECELLAECYRGGVYLAVCGVLLPVSELESSYCDDAGCDRMVTYCQACLCEAVGTNADAGLELVAAGPALTGSLSDPEQVCRDCGGGR